MLIQRDSVEKIVLYVGLIAQSLGMPTVVFKQHGSNFVIDTMNLSSPKSQLTCNSVMLNGTIEAITI
jgi:hypothetical protein